MPPQVDSSTDNKFLLKFPVWAMALMEFCEPDEVPELELRVAAGRSSQPKIACALLWTNEDLVRKYVQRRSVTGEHFMTWPILSRRQLLHYLTESAYDCTAVIVDLPPPQQAGRPMLKVDRIWLIDFIRSSGQPGEDLYVPGHSEN